MPDACSVRLFRRWSSGTAISAARRRSCTTRLPAAANGTGRQPFAGNVIPASHDQPDRAPHSRAHPRAEHPRRGARSDQLSVSVSAEEDDGRVRREDQPSGHGRQRADGALQLSASGDQRSRHLRHLRRRREGLCRHRHQPDDQHRRDVDPDLERHARSGNSRRRQLLPQRGADRRRAGEDLRRARHQRREHQRFLGRHHQRLHRRNGRGIGALQPAGRRVSQRACPGIGRNGRRKSPRCSRRAAATTR